MIEHGIRYDHQREQRLGFDEAVYSASKSLAQLSALIAQAMDSGTSRLFTRLSPEQVQALAPAQREALDYDTRSRTAFVRASARPLRDVGVAVLTAGSSDSPAAFEAVRTLAYYGYRAHCIEDVGVAGLWRLLEHVDMLREMRVLIVSAGMEGALFSVVGGLLPGVVVALPTSVGYGVSANGHAALQSALASCAPGVLSVNIDNGYGAACAALRMLRAMRAD